MWENPAVDPAISRAVGTYVRDQIFSSAAVAAGRLDTIFHCEIIGRRDWSPRGALAKLDDHYDLASLTKPLVVGSLLALAVGKGKVSLDGTVDRYLPSAKDSGWGKRQI